MRTAGTSSLSLPVSKLTRSYKAAAAAPEDTISPPANTQSLQWHSPVPYLFGGLSAMLGLIAFALLILACTYWKLSGHVNGGERDAEGGVSADEKGEDASDAKASPAFEQSVLVIMAGEAKPTFLATPTSSRVASFNLEKPKSDQNPAEANGEASREAQLSQDQIQT